MRQSGLPAMYGITDVLVEEIIVSFEGVAMIYYIDIEHCIVAEANSGNSVQGYPQFF